MSTSRANDVAQPKRNAPIFPPGCQPHPSFPFLVFFIIDGNKSIASHTEVLAVVTAETSLPPPPPPSPPPPPAFQCTRATTFEGQCLCDSRALAAVSRRWTLPVAGAAEAAWVYRGGGGWWGRRGRHGRTVASSIFSYTRRKSLQQVTRPGQRLNQQVTCVPLRARRLDTVRSAIAKGAGGAWRRLSKQSGTRGKKWCDVFQVARRPGLPGKLSGRTPSPRRRPPWGRSRSSSSSSSSSSSRAGSSCSMARLSDQSQPLR